ncbi:AbrB family transcriptional regulator [Secundilactobacillus oryzae JCM 18671]|uniref:AbrB family transcriptional regulator n=1 Tax=Secundilactobacillus oryzae JCM 18671 TaxID=1291743 RepID=A0A081BJN3_9LACO|nr:helix-turn-helix transcriptional regulator [Secundilactobacillus oryzae]GAK48251.1 AbrB family transcriptional regulator [Secundilactobacillus oryzae JCM 18671]
MDEKQIIATNIRSLRQSKKWSQEAVAEQLHVTRQAYAKWENGDSLPDLLKCVALSKLYDVDLNDLVTYDASATGIPIGPAGKHLFGVVSVGNGNTIAIPDAAMKTMKYQIGTKLVLLGDTNPGTVGLAMIDASQFMAQTGPAFNRLFEDQDS